MTDLHEVSFSWPAGPYKVILTGEFDNWSQSTELTKTDNGFTGVLYLPWDRKVPYKYIVNGQWRVDPAKPQAADGAGNINNVYTSPPKPAQSPPVAAPAAPVTSIVSYMASGLGAVFASVTGIDPINSKQIPIEEKSDSISAVKSPPERDEIKAEPTPTIGAAHDSTVPDAAIDAKTANTVMEQASVEATTVKESIPTSVEEVKDIAAIGTDDSSKLPESILNVSEKTQEPITHPTGLATPDAPEPYKEAPISDPISVPDAVEPHKETNGTLPGEASAAPAKLPESAESVKGTRASLTDSTTVAPSKASEPVEKVKDSFDAKKMRHSIAGSTPDGTLKRKKRHSIIVKLKELFTPEKQKKAKAASSSS